MRLDTDNQIVVLQGEVAALAWLEQQPSPRICMIIWIEVRVAWRDGFLQLPPDDAIANERLHLH